MDKKPVALVVDDMKHVVALITRYLEQDGFDVLTAYDGYEALDKVHTADYIDIILLDIMMPGLSGYDVCQRIREDYTLFELPILFLTAKTLVSDKMTAFEVGGNDYLTKPFDSKELIARTKTLVRMKKLGQAHETLQMAINTKNRLMKMYVHDLKSPLSSIRLITDVLLSNANPEHIDINQLSLIGESSDRMLELINQILDVSRIEAGNIRLNKQSFNIAEFIHFIINHHQPAADKKNISIDINIISDSVHILADRSKLQQIIDNFISNAIKYSPSGESVTISLIDKGDAIIIEILDHGQGFTEEDKKNMFNPFEKLSARPTAGESSTGLGLYIAHQLTEMHNGRIELQTEKGKYSKFRIHMPKQ